MKATSEELAILSLSWKAAASAGRQSSLTGQFRCQPGS